jgi:hypothetical protein
MAGDPKREKISVCRVSAGLASLARRNRGGVFIHISTNLPHQEDPGIMDFAGPTNLATMP